jgi:cysteine-rich repeat protein
VVVQARVPAGDVVLGRAAIIAIALAGCVRAELVTCADGSTCPLGKVCDAVHGGCVGPDQLAVCTGAVFDSPCTSNEVNGACFDGVCLPTGCGNGVIEPGEQCDPPGPNCSADCSSNLTCGNGVVDVSTGEQCDDGNLRNHDGCDSKCRTETLTYDAQTYRPAYVWPTSAVMDAARGVFVHYDTWATWGAAANAQWSLLATNGPSGTDNESLLAYDSDRRVVVLLSGSNGAGAPRVFEWNGTAWSARATTGNAPTDMPFTALYDPGSKTVMALVYSTTCTTICSNPTIDTWALSATNAWSHLKSQSAPFGSYADVAIYDPQRAADWLFAPDGSVMQWSGNQWVAVANSKLAQLGGFDRDHTNYVYDGDAGAVVVRGSRSTNPATNAGIYDGTPYQWNGTAWVANSSAALPAAALAGFSEVVYDAAAHRTHYVVGVFNAVPRMVGSYWTLDQGAVAWQRRDPPMPFSFQGSYSNSSTEQHNLATFVGGSVTHAETTDDTWVLGDAGWTQSPAGGLVAPIDGMAADPIRGAVVAVSYSTGAPAATMKLDANGWSAMAIAAPTDSQNRGIAFDPVARRIVMVGATSTWALDSTAADAASSSWTNIGGAPPQSFGGILAFDLACGCMLWTDVESVHKRTYALDGSTWTPTSAVDVDVVATWSARESAMLVPYVADGQPTWESRVDALERGVTIPHRFAGALADDPRRGVVRSVGVVDGFYGVMSIGYRGPGNDELCDGHDGDGDGLVDCADPDCWWSCTPACPPGVSCK